MSDAVRLSFASLAKRHDRSDFDCGVEPLNTYLQRQAGQEQRKRVAFSFVMTDEGQNEVLGFYTLSSSAVQLTDIPDDLRIKLPHYPFMPVTLLGRLALDRRCRGKGYGRFLLIDALARACRTDSVASIAVVTDPKDESARLFYEQFGFEPLGSGNRLFLRMQTIQKLTGSP